MVVRTLNIKTVDEAMDSLKTEGISKERLDGMSMDDLRSCVLQLFEEVDSLKSDQAGADPSNGDTGKVDAKGFKKSKGDKGKYIPKTPLGMKDYMPSETALRRRVFAAIQGVFMRHGAVTIETPVMELKETLVGKYGEDSKLIYDLADQGGEILSLRYDLTVPFARFCAEHGIERIKRYHIDRVYRRDNPVIKQGRFREFYQCDFDIAGAYEPMVPDAECVKVVTEILSTLDVGEFEVKINHRGLLDGIFEAAGVPSDLFRPICSAVDKLDKLEWTEVKDEMIRKGISDSCAEFIRKYVKRRGGRELVDELLNDEVLLKSESAKQSLESMRLMFRYCDAYDALDHVVFDLSLARGLDYYTGVIYEATLKDAKVGSVAGGGRYDNLVGRFLSAKMGKKSNKKAKQIPCVGVSLGIERLFTVVADRASSRGDKSAFVSKDTEVLVAGIASGDDKHEVLEERMRICSQLWAAGIPAETSYKTNTKFMTQIQECENSLIPICVCIGKSELESGIVKVNHIVPGEPRKETVVSRSDLVMEIRRILDQR